MVVIIDYGMGNIGSLVNMIQKIGVSVCVSANKQDIERATTLILPGVGSFDAGMNRLDARNLISIVTQKVINQKTPILGVCLGFQLFSNQSEEGVMRGLGLINAKTVKFDEDRTRAHALKIPHMGWNTIHKKKSDDALLSNFDTARFYFAHSYHVQCANTHDILATTTYGQEFASIVRHQNIMGVQFHPEKSHRFGVQFFKNFFNSTRPLC